MDDVVPEGYMKNPRGMLVPTDKVKPEHIMEDGVVRDLVAQAEEINRTLARFREKVFGEVASFRELIAEKYDAKKGGAKGNVTLSSYDGTLQLQVSIGESITFGPELEAAKSLIDDCVLRWSENSGSEIKALVQHAFQTNKQGKIDTGRVLSLRQLEIDDPQWAKAMEAISDAVKVTGSKTYARFYRRDPITDAKTAISLDIANA